MLGLILEKPEPCRHRSATLASFGVHLAVGLSASGLAATTTLAAGLTTPGEMLTYLGLGTLGSLLPDLDADNSAPLQIAFTLVSAALAFSAMFLLADTFRSVAELLILWLTTYLFFRILVFALFTHLTSHRGVFHSIPAAALFGMLTAILATRVLHQPPLQAWLGGLFVTCGYLLHLLLDELYSVNLFGMRTRRSLGTAFKLWSRASPAATLYLYLACAGSYLAAPSPRPIWDALSSPRTYARVQARLLPQAGWFHPARDSIAARELHAKGSAGPRSTGRARAQGRGGG
jgi:membrane-bound metal-dependent hydrolase YbcI (DUF457 family)